MEYVKNIALIAFVVIAGTLATFSAQKDVAFAQVGIGTLDQWAATTSPSAAITQRTFGKAIKLTGLPTGQCLSLDSNGIVTTSACSGGGGGSGVGTISTSTALVVGQVPYVTSNGYPARITSIATSSVSSGSGISLTGTPGSLVGGTALTIALDTNFDKGFFFSTTSADAWKNTRNFFATTSADFWKTQNNFFATTSADFLATQRNYFATTSAIFFVNSSTTIPKTYTNNYFATNTLQWIPYATSSAISSDYASSTQWWGGGLLSTCASGNFLTWTSGRFGCAADQTGGGGSGSGNVATSTAETAGQLPFWTTTAGSPARVGSVATSSLTSGTGILFTGTAGALVGGTALTLSIDPNLDKGFFFSTTSANAWKAVNNFFATTSADFWKTQTSFFSTTSEDFYKSQNNFFATTSAIFFVNGSTTIPKTYTNNYFATGTLQWIPFASSTSMTIGNLFATNATTTSLAVTNLASGSCDVKSNGGILFCGTDATGGSGVQLPTWTVKASGGDFTTIQAALDQCGLQGGGTIFLADTTYNQGATGLTFKGSKCNIYGRMASTTITFTGATTLFKTNSAAALYANNGIHDIQITGDGNDAGIAIDMSDMSHSNYNNIKIDSVGTAYRLNDTQDITFYNRVSGGHITNVDVAGINASSTRPVNDNEFHNLIIRCTNTPGCIGINLNNAQANKFVGVTVEPSGTNGTVGIKIGASSLATNNGTFSNIFDNVYMEGNGIALAASSTVGSAAVFGNNFYGGQIELNTTNIMCESTDCYEAGFFGVGINFLNVNQLASTIIKSRNHGSILSLQDEGFLDSALRIRNNTNFAHSNLDYNKIELLNVSDTSHLLNLSNLGSGATIIATSTRGTDFILSGGRVGIATTTPAAALGLQGDMFIAGRIVSTSTLSSIFPFASSTAFTAGNLFSTYATTTQLGITGVPNALLSTNVNGTVVATTTLASSYFTGIDKGFFFSTTSASFFLSQNQSAAFSTTSAIFFVNASTTIPKTYTNNYYATNTLQWLPYASSTASTVGNLFATNATTTSLAITNLTSASCDVKSTTGGVLFCGTDATGGGGGTFPFDPVVYGAIQANSTSTLLVFTQGLVTQASSTMTDVTMNRSTTTNATTTSLAVLNLTSASCDVKATTGGILFCGTDATGGGGGTFAWTPTINFGALANATGTPIWFQAGLQASSTSRMSTTTFEGFVGISSTTPWAQLSIGTIGGSLPYFTIGSPGQEVFKIAPSTLPKFAVGKTYANHTVDVKGRISGQPQYDCQTLFMGQTNVTADQLGSATVASFACNSNLFIDVNTANAGILANTAANSESMASGTPALQLLDSTIATPLINNLVFLKGMVAGSATSSLGDGIAMQGVLMTPTVGTATTSKVYWFGFSDVALTSITTTTTYSNPSNGCGLSASSTAKWRFICYKAGVQTIADTGFATSTNAFKALIVVDAQSARLYINDSSTPSATIASASVPVVRLRPVFGVGNLSGSAVASGRFGIGNITVWTEDKY